MQFARRVREFCPPVLWEPLKRLTGHATRYETGYQTWDQARAASEGYDAGVDPATVVAATRKVVAGEAAYERDSVLFDHLDCPFALLFPLLRAMAESGGRLAVLDFGGSLGSTYRQCRPFLGAGPVSWCVIEQPSFVAAGQQGIPDRRAQVLRTRRRGPVPGAAERVSVLQQPAVSRRSGSRAPSRDCKWRDLSHDRSHAVRGGL